MATEEAKVIQETSAEKKVPEAEENFSVDLAAPAGWKKKFMPKMERTPGTGDVLFIAPSGEVIKNKRKLDQYFNSHSDCPPSSEFDWGDTPRRSAGISEKLKATESPEDEKPKKHLRLAKRKSESQEEKKEEKETADPKDDKEKEKGAEKEMDGETEPKEEKEKDGDTEMKDSDSAKNEGDYNNATDTKPEIPEEQPVSEIPEENKETKPAENNETKPEESKRHENDETKPEETKPEDNNETKPEENDEGKPEETVKEALENLKNELRFYHRKVSIALGLNDQDVAKKEEYKQAVKKLRIKPEANGRVVPISVAFKLDVLNREKDEKVLENQTVPQPSSIVLDTKQDATTRTIQFRTAPQAHPLLITVGLSKDVRKKVMGKVLVNLTEELKCKHAHAYMMGLELFDKIFEWDKISFGRAMEKAWLANSIIMGRCLIDQSRGDQRNYEEMQKVLYFNEKLKCVIDAGLHGILFGPLSNKLKREELGVLNDLNCSNKRLLPPEDKEKIVNFSKSTSSPFAKLESREEYLEEYLESIINSLLERENERESETDRAREATENEILGYMLLQEIAKCTTLKFPSMELPNSIRPSSSDGEQRDEKVVVQINKQLYTERVKAKFNYPESWALNFYAYLMKAKSASNNSYIELEHIKQMLAMLEEVIRETGWCLVRYQNYESKLAVERRSETKLFEHCEGLCYYVRLDRRLNPVSETEVNQLEKIMCLAGDAIEKYTRANGPDSLPTITQPLLPTWRHLIS